MRKALIHIRLGSINLPQRHLDDTDRAHDVIEVEIGDNEEVKECELVTRGEPVYSTDMETEEEARSRAEMVGSARGIVSGIGGNFTGNTDPTPRQVTRKLKGLVKYRYRIVTLEVIDADIEADGREQGELAAGEVVDADVVEEST